ncbi:alpha/beta hydrolase [Embleya sp. NBC_00896]|uniref:alpha/beta fold hydrolase n=1 Tax=Embleya sp. NBC_00896 TaxID=2975961 RepID=UPI002F90F038|nr:alpha/beta hydrolase [Embleya sp. NBC_00896]
MPTRTLPTPTFARTVRGSGPGLLVAHGSGGSVAGNYGPILDGLAAGHTVVGVDYPGTGDTPRSAGPLSLDDLADQLVAAGDAEGLDTFAVAGYSLGGAVAIRAATRHPERVTALVLTAAFAHPDARLTLASRVWRGLYESGDHAALAAFLVPTALSPAAFDALSPDTLTAVLAMTAESAPAGTPEHTDLVERTDVRADLAAITVPALVVSTTGDNLVAPALHRAVAAGLPNARLIELPAGHLPFAERPEEWLTAITTFLTEVGR